VRQELLEGRLAATGIFAPEYLRTLLDEHQTGRRDHSAPLWSLLMFNGFCRRVLDGGGSS
jgi:asparagine synthase (glutamine-hydrolysing)